MSTISNAWQTIFVAAVRQRLDAIGVSLDLRSGMAAPGGAEVIGWMDPKSRTVVVFTGGTFAVWAATLAHEASHAMQWAERSPFWLLAEKGPAGNAMDIFTEVIAGRAVGREKLKDASRRLVQLEADAERRAYMLLREFGLLEEVGDYFCHANAYLCCIAMLPETGRMPASAKERRALGAALDTLPDELIPFWKAKAPEGMVPAGFRGALTATLAPQASARAA